MYFSPCVAEEEPHGERLNVLLGVTQLVQGGAEFESRALPPEPMLVAIAL